MAFVANFTDNSGKVLSAFQDKVKMILAQIGETCEGYAKEDCPVDTGLLRNSITYAVYGEGTAITGYSADRTKPGESAPRSGHYSGRAPDDGEPCVFIGSNVEYAKKQEYGDYEHRVGKKHFLRDAATTHNDEYKKIAETILRA